MKYNIVAEDQSSVGECFIVYDLISKGYQSGSGLIFTRTSFNIDDLSVTSYISSTNRTLANIFLLRTIEQRDQQCSDNCRTIICDLFPRMFFEIRFNLSYYCYAYRICKNVKHIIITDRRSLDKYLRSKYDNYDTIVPYSTLLANAWSRVEEKIRRIQSIDGIELIEPEFVVVYDKGKSMINVIESFIDFDVKLSVNSLIKLDLTKMGVDVRLFDHTGITIANSMLDVRTFLSSDANL